MSDHRRAERLQHVGVGSGLRNDDGERAQHFLGQRPQLRTANTAQQPCARTRFVCVCVCVCVRVCVCVCVCV